MQTVFGNIINNYRYGFNGQEKDNEIKGTGNSLAYEARIYDSRLGKWLSVDPLQAKYPSLSTYHFGANNPVLYVDKDGRQIFTFGQASDVFKFVAQLQQGTTMKVELNVLTNQVMVTGLPLTQADFTLLQASNSNSVNVNMYATTAGKVEMRNDPSITPLA
ncbi:MAG: RHS repeat-associated core domain-containing protein [Chitinophagaceae bacterium]